MNTLPTSCEKYQKLKHKAWKLALFCAFNKYRDHQNVDELMTFLYNMDAQPDEKKLKELITKVEEIGRMRLL